MTHKKSLLKIIGFAIFVTLLALVYKYKYTTVESDYSEPKILATHYNGEHFVGSSSCFECHADVYKDHLKTAHFNTSGLADSLSVKGNFNEGANTLDLRDISFRMTHENDSLYQHTTIKNRNVESFPTKFDIVIGSGVKGQSYLNWEDEDLFQMHVSYYTPMDIWVKSPSFPEYSYSRTVGDACLKCHLTFATNRNPSGQGNSYDRERMLYGVDCERCHRPAEKHVSYHRNNPEEKTAKYMMKFAELSRQKRLDVCAQCHSGLREQLLKGTPFSFLAGEDLKEHSQNINTGPVDNSKLDVHGNQYGLLTSSECFKQTATMDCISCHDPHKNQRGNSPYFNQKCVGCHSAKTIVCTANSEDVEHMGNNCISCHMPSSPSKSMTVDLKNDSLGVPFYVRTHLIAVYPKEKWTNN